MHKQHQKPYIGHACYLLVDAISPVISPEIIHVFYRLTTAATYDITVTARISTSQATILWCRYVTLLMAYSTNYKSGMIKTKKKSVTSMSVVSIRYVRLRIITRHGIRHRSSLR